MSDSLGATEHEKASSVPRVGRPAKSGIPLAQLGEAVRKGVKFARNNPGEAAQIIKTVAWAIPIAMKGAREGRRSTHGLDDREKVKKSN